MFFDRKKKTSRGRQKVELKKIENEDALYISFSKRRNGVFAKANEISTLCGAEVLVLIYSPAGKPHTFGSPDVHLLANRFFSGGIVQPVGSLSEQAYRKGRMRGLNGQMMELGRSLESYKGRKNAILEHITAMTQGLDLDEHEEGMTYEKLEELKKKIEVLKGHVEDHVSSQMGDAYRRPHADDDGGLSPPYARTNPSMAMHTLDPYMQPGLGSSQHRTMASLLNTFDSVPGPSDPLELVMSLNPTGTANFHGTPESSVPFHVDCSDRNRQSGTELNNLFK